MLAQVIEQIDEANARDPHKEQWKGKEYAKELLYGQRMTDMLLSYSSDPSEELQIAARGQHIMRWTIPRETYPMDRKGYLKWRTDLKIFHGKKLNEIMSAVGYPPEACKKVVDLVMKKGLKKDPETQCLEDVICMVFLKFYFSDFAAQHPDEKIISIIRKTWDKMTINGREHALALSLPDKDMALIKQALTSPHS